MRTLIDPGTRQEIENELEIFCMDLRTLTFYTEFLFTRESKQFRYDLRREPDGYNYRSGNASSR